MLCFVYFLLFGLFFLYFLLCLHYEINLAATQELNFHCLYCSIIERLFVIYPPAMDKILLFAILFG